MMVYVESNFVLELVFEQQYAPAAEAILVMSEAGSIQLGIPAIALVEPYSTAGYRNLDRRAMIETWKRELNPSRLTELGLTDTSKRLRLEYAQALQELTDLAARQESRLASTIDRLVGVATILQSDAQMFTRARAYQAQYALDPLDSMIYATILGHLESIQTPQPSCFVSRDSQAFARKAISDELATHGSRYISTFTNALAFIQGARSAGEPPA